MTAHLSRLVLEPRHRDVQRDLADCDRMHRRVMSAFPNVPASPARRELGVLYRVEQSPGGVQLLVQSGPAPTWRDLPDGYLQVDWLTGASVAVTSLDPLLARVAEGASFRFRLRANPTRKVDTKTGPDGARRHGRRVPLRQEASRLEWLGRKAILGGFALVEVGGGDLRLPDVIGVRPERLTGTRHASATGAQRITVEGVQFEGRLRVTDAARFRATLLTGIGAGKAYGFGLLSVAPE